MLDWVIDDIDLILVMSVVTRALAGKASLIRRCKIEARASASTPRVATSGWEVDGGIKTDNIRRVVDAGADTLWPAARFLQA